MAKPRARTLQQRFGFMDNDLKAPEHDEIMLWLNDNIYEIVSRQYWGTSWKEDYVLEQRTLADSIIKAVLEEQESRRQSEWAREKADKRISELNAWDGLGDLPEVPELKLSITWESPVKSKEYIIGFIDMKVEWPSYSLAIGGIERLKYQYSPSGQKLPPYRIQSDKLPHWIVREYNQYLLCFEIKTTIPSLGELIRQIHMYREYQGGKFVIVSPDDRFKETLKQQRISFLKYDPPNLTFIE